MPKQNFQTVLFSSFSKIFPQFLQAQSIGNLAMVAKLQDDTKSKSVGIYGPALAREVAEIAKFRVNRAGSAYAWARNLRFLTYDDEDDDEEERERNRVIPTEVEPEDQDEGLQRAIELSLSQAADVSEDAISTDNPISNHLQNKLGQEVRGAPADDSDDEAAQLDYAIALSLAEEDQAPQQAEESSPKKTIHGDDKKTCATCQSYPRFPNWKRPTKFRVVRFDPDVLEHAQLCNHYLAISYCWKSDSSGNAAASPKSYRVRVQQPDGTYVERFNRAPNETIDRAVDCARLAGPMGIRLIWIDQECLPQDDSKEQELGIQAMDMVYQRAHVSAGLFESFIQSQAQLDVIASVLDYGRNGATASGKVRQRRPGVPMRDYCEYLMDFLELFADDHWNTRAWILQEAFTSSQTLEILIRTAPSVQFHPVPSQIPTLQIDPNMIPGTFAISMSDVLGLFQVARKLLLSVVKSEDMSGQVYRGSAITPEDYSSAWFARASNILDRVDELYPIPTGTTNRHAFMYAVGGSNFGSRKRCNAAVALYFLRPRLNHRPADRLAILANLCNYQVGLDTVEIEKRFTSLATCLFTLAYINGDLSLLNPDAYYLGGMSNLKEPLAEGPSWALPFQEIFCYASMNILHTQATISLRNTERYRLSESGMTLPANLWNIERMVDLSPIKAIWQSRWRMATCFQVEFDYRENETPEEERARKTEVARQVKLAQGFGQSLEEVQRSIVGEVFQPDPSFGAHVIRTFSADRTEHSKDFQDLIGNIFLDILRYLYYNGENALANSIWHSIRIDCARVKAGSEYIWSDSNNDSLPDDVADLLSNSEYTSNPYLLLQLTRTSKGTWSQVWIVERIMVYGVLWAGNYVSPTRHTFEAMSANEARENRNAPESSAPEGKLNIIQGQSVKQLLGFQLMSDLHKAESAEHAATASKFLSFVYRGRFEMNAMKRESYLFPQVAVFDVDGPCMVITPYDSEAERLPLSPLRSMAAAWVVESAPVETQEVAEEIGNTDKQVDPQREDCEKSNNEVMSPDNRNSVDASMEEDLYGANEVVPQITSTPKVVVDDVPKVEEMTIADEKILNGNAPVETVTDETLEVDKGNGVSKSEGDLPMSNKNLTAESIEIPSPKLDKGKGISRTEEEAAPPPPAGMEKLLKTQKFVVRARVQGMWEIMDEPLHLYTFV